MSLLDQVLLAIDGGGTHTRCLCFSRDGRILAEADGGPSNHLQVDRAIVCRSLSETIAATLAKAGVPRERVVLVSAGLAGVDYDGTGEPEAAGILQEIGFPNAAIHGDMVIAHRGALSGNPGVLALAGTGASFLGIAADGAMAKAGGWGPIYGDEGSSYWIVRRALEAASKATDGRGPATSLVSVLSEGLGVRRFEDSVLRIYVQGMPAREIAALSPQVSSAAEAGDAVAGAILREAGRELAEGAIGILRRLSFGPADAAVSYQGSLLANCRLVREEFSAALGCEMPGTRILPPRFEPVIGAYLLGCRALGWESRYGR